MKYAIFYYKIDMYKQTWGLRRKPTQKGILWPTLAEGLPWPT